MSNVLICNDDESITGPLKYRLEGEGHNVETAHGALEALNKTLKGNFSALILNLDIEEGSGSYLVPVRNALDEGVAVITFTCEDSLELQRLARQGKVFFHAVWPLDRNAISTAVKNAEALIIKRQSREKGILKAIIPSYLKKRIHGYIAPEGNEWARPLPRENV